MTVNTTAEVQAKAQTEALVYTSALQPPAAQVRLRRHTQPSGECAECRRKRLQRRSNGHAEPSIVPPIVHDVLRSPGQPLDLDTRAFMEPRFGHDFSQVRIHADAKAAESARAVNAQAYTVGRDVVFGAEQHAPRTPGGRRLLAHELTHVLQQRQSRGSASPQTTSELSHPADLTESEADAVAQRVAAGQRSWVGAHAAPLIQRQATTTSEDARSVGEHATRTALHEAALREMYHRGEAAIAQEARAMLAAGKSEVEVARWAVEARNALRRAIREQGEPIVDAIARTTRGARDMPSYEQLRAAGKTDAQIVESAARSNLGVNRWVGRIRIAGRIFIALDIGVATYNVATAPEVDRPRVLAREVGRVGGVLAGGWAGAKGGAALGGAIGSVFPGAGTAIGAGVGGVIGGIGGAIFGGWAGSEAAEWTIEQFYPPNETRFEQSG